MVVSLTIKQHQVVEKAQWVAMECLAPRAARYDETATHPWESWIDLWRHGLLAIAIPKDYGGLELDMLSYIMVIESLSYGCTSSAMTLHMHSVVQQFIDALGTPQQKTLFYPDVVKDGKMFGSWGSEPNRRGGSGFSRETIISKVGEGYTINGRKHFCTMAGAAHRCLIHGSMEDYEGPGGFQLALIPSNTSGMEIVDDWDTLGMRATVSPSVIFKDCRIDRECLLGEPGNALEKGIIEGFGLGYAAVYLGAAQRSLDFTTEYCKTNKFAPEPKPLSHNLLVQRNIAEMTIALDSARLILYESARLWNKANPAIKRTLAARAKLIATESALNVTSTCAQTIGGRSAHKKFPVERIFRDMRTATLMPPNIDRCMEILGKSKLDIED